MSPRGSLIVIAQALYQLDLTIPGICPAEASSRNAMRESLNFRYYPRGRPGSEQRFRPRVSEPLRGSSASLSCAEKRASGGAVLSTAIAFNRARRPAILLASFIRLAFFPI